MKIKILVNGVILILIAIFLLSCTKKMPELKTSIGALSIAKVTLSKIDPYTSNSAPDGYQCLGIVFISANSKINLGEINDFKVRGNIGSVPTIISKKTTIIDKMDENKVSTEGKKEIDKSNVIGDNSSGQILSFQQAINGTYVVGDDSSKPIVYWDGLSNGQLFSSCLIKSTAKKFILYWPDNAPIELIVSK